MTEHVLLVSLGPIQDFIASARRCQDLWFGSWMLSDLARATASAIREACGTEDALVFPASLEVGDGVQDKPAVANKILAITPADTTPATIAERGRTCMMERLEELSDAAFQRLPMSPHFHRETARAQILDLLEYVWVAAPLADRRQYAEVRSGAERLLAARKGRRTWSAVSWGAAVPKSSLDGLRESVLDEALYEGFERVDRRGDTMSARELRGRWFVKKGERLCGVGLLKRIGSEVEIGGSRTRRPAFHSTSHVAAAPLRTRIARLGQSSIADAYARTLSSLVEADHHTLPDRLLVRGGRVATVVSPLDQNTVATPPSFGASGFDGRLLYQGQLPAILEETSAIFSAAPERSAVRRQLERTATRALHELGAALGVSPDAVPAYYVVLLADGDNMGKALDRVGRESGLVGHKRLAAALDAFSRDCRRIVEGQAGSLVYAGGDDVLALLPLHTALQCARELHDAFARHLRDAMDSKDASEIPTLSIGLGCGHHLTDMAETRELARAAERAAKSVAGKDALAIALQLRSGGRLEVVDRWSASLPLDRRLVDWARLQLLEAIPGKAAHELEAEMAPLLQRGRDGVTPGDLGAVARSLAARVLDRRRGERGVEALSSQVRLLLDTALSGSDVAGRVTTLSAELQIARLFADAYGVAFGDAQNPAKGEPW